MESEKRWPKAGQLLTHRFVGRQGRHEVVAEVVEVDQANGKVWVRVDHVVYKSLSGAAKALTGHEENGWIFWGLLSDLRKQRTENG